MQVRRWIFLNVSQMFFGFSVHSIRCQLPKELWASLYNWVRYLYGRNFTNRDIIFHSYYDLNFTFRPLSPSSPPMPFPNPDFVPPPQSTLLFFLFRRGQISLEYQQNVACFCLGKDSWYLQAIACVLACFLGICVFVTDKYW